VPQQIFDSSAAPAAAGQSASGANRASSSRTGTRGAKLAITIFDSYEDILDVACDAWTFFENDKQRVAAMANRSRATVSI